MRDAAQRIYEQMLVTRCQTGDEAAFAELVGLYHRRIGYFVRRLLGDAAAADDVLQETWLAAFRNLARLSNPAAFSVWLYRIARSKACQELRRRRAWVELDDRTAAPDAADAPGGELQFTAEHAALIHRCLDRLDPPQREVLVLRFLENMAYEDIAAVTGCPMGTVRSRLHYAKWALRREMERSHESR